MHLFKRIGGKMPSLFWGIEWDFGSYPLSKELEESIIRVIRQRVEGHQLTVKDVGSYLSNLPISIEDSNTSFSACLEKIDPALTFTITSDTNIFIHLTTDTPRQDLHGGDMTGGPSLAKELEEMVMFETTFNPSNPDSHYMKIYESLVGIPKDLILNEMISLLMPFNTKEKWSKRHYGNIIPGLINTINKAPVIILGGDPGTGKTALATSIGAPLANAMGERIHFRHMSLMLRGMGYQGRASGMIVKLFDHIKNEYIQSQEPILLFFDEAEAVVGSRGEADSSSGAQENIAVVDAIIVGVDGLRKGLQARVLAIFATNLNNRVDSALKRRSYYYPFERPSEKARYEIFKNSLAGINLSGDDYTKLVAATEPREVNGKTQYFTASDIVELIIGRSLNYAISHDKPLDLDILLNFCSSTNPTP